MQRKFTNELDGIYLSLFSADSDENAFDKIGVVQSFELVTHCITYSGYKNEGKHLEPWIKFETEADQFEWVREGLYFLYGVLIKAHKKEFYHENAQIKAAESHIREHPVCKFWKKYYEETTIRLAKEKQKLEAVKHKNQE